MRERRSIAGDAGESRRERAWKWVVIVMAVVYLAFSLWFMLDIRARLRRLEHSDIKGRLRQNINDAHRFPFDTRGRFSPH